MELAVERALIEIGGGADGRPCYTAHVDVVRELDVDVVLSAVDNSSNPLKLVGVTNEIVAIDKIAIGFVGSAAVLADTIDEFVRINILLAVLVAIADVALGGDTVAVEITDDINLLVGRIVSRLFVLAQRLVPADFFLVAVEGVGQGTVSHPFGCETLKGVGFLLVVLLVEVEGADEVAVVDAASEALVAVTVLQLTCVEAADNLACAGEPAGEDTVLFAAFDITCVPAVLDDDLEGTT